MESGIKGRISDHLSVFEKKWGTDAGLAVMSVSNSITQVPQPNEKMIQGQIDEEVFAHTRKSTPRQLTEEAFDEATPHPAKKARSLQSNLRPKLDLYGTGNEPSGDLDPQVVFAYTRKQPAAPRTKREPATIIPSSTSSQFAAIMAEPAKETTEPIESATHMAI